LLTDICAQALSLEAERLRLRRALGSRGERPRREEWINEELAALRSLMGDLKAELDRMAACGAERRLRP
jgi:hypothetical protein